MSNETEKQPLLLELTELVKIRDGREVAHAINEWINGLSEHQIVLVREVVGKHTMELINQEMNSEKEYKYSYGKIGIEGCDHCQSPVPLHHWQFGNEEYKHCAFCYMPQLGNTIRIEISNALIAHYQHLSIYPSSAIPDNIIPST